METPQPSAATPPPTTPTAPEPAKPRYPDVPDLKEPVALRWNRGKPVPPTTKPVEAKAVQIEKKAEPAPQAKDKELTQEKEPPKDAQKAKEGQDEGKGAEAKKELENAQEKAPKIFSEKVKAKIDGEEVEVTVGDLVKAYQKATSADKRFQEAAFTKKQAVQLIQALQADPFAILEHPALGLKQDKLREMLENRLYKFIELENMDPKDREIVEMKHQLKIHEEGKKKEAEEAHQREVSALAERYTKDYEKDIVEALEMGGLPRSPFTVKQMAYYIKEGLSRGVRLKAADVVDIVKDDFTTWMRDLWASADGDKLIELFGQEAADKIRKAELKKFKGGPPSPIPEEERPAELHPQRKYLSRDEFRARNREIKSGLR